MIFMKKTKKDNEKVHVNIKLTRCTRKAAKKYKINISQVAEYAIVDRINKIEYMKQSLKGVGS